jgi:hypothetical protein
MLALKFIIRPTSTAPSHATAISRKRTRRTSSHGGFQGLRIFWNQHHQLVRVIPIVMVLRMRRTATTTITNKAASNTSTPGAQEVSATSNSIAATRTTKTRTKKIPARYRRRTLQRGRRTTKSQSRGDPCWNCACIIYPPFCWVQTGSSSSNHKCSIGVETT